MTDGLKTKHDHDDEVIGMALPRRSGIFRKGRFYYTRSKGTGRKRLLLHFPLMELAFGLSDLSPGQVLLLRWISILEHDVGSRDQIHEEQRAQVVKSNLFFEDHLWMQKDRWFALHMSRSHVCKPGLQGG